MDTLTQSVSFALPFVPLTMHNVTLLSLFIISIMSNFRTYFSPFSSFPNQSSLIFISSLYNIFIIFSLYCILKSCICRSITMCCLATHLISCSLDFSSSLYSCFFPLPPIDHRFAVYPSISQFLVFFFQFLGHTDLYSWI